jgi:hypothetical protein
MQQIFFVFKASTLVWEKDLYCIVLHKISVLGRKAKMKNPRNKEEIRWQVVKAMLDEFPTLKEKVRNYVKTAEN